MTKIGKSVLKAKPSRQRPPTREELETMQRIIEEERRRREMEQQRKKHPPPKYVTAPAPKPKDIAQEAVEETLGPGMERVEEIRELAKSRGVSYTTAERMLELQKKKQE